MTVTTPTAIEVRDLDKTFRVPKYRMDTLKERALHPFRRTEYELIRPLRGVSFDIGAGEFFGIVGRNGSGKSTLLKCLAGIYGADRGSIRVGGRLAPFIELGVGFNPDLTARDNVVINAVMIGLTPAEARARFDPIIAFAELEDFLDLKLKNYSSGMQVRLAFSVMVQSDADVLLIDEVLAVGDAAFQQKCLDEFYRLKAGGKTIVLVTHDMATIDRFCHRAMLLQDGVVEQIGEPGEVGRRYLDLNFERRERLAAGMAEGDGAVLADLRVEDDRGRVATSVAHGSSIRVDAEAVMRTAVGRAWVTVWVDNEDGLRVFGASRDVGSLEPGERLRLRLRSENPLITGHYYVGWSIEHGPGTGDFAVFQARATDVVVYGGDAVGGLVAVPHELDVERVGERVRS